MERKGIIFNIMRYSIDDGPGIRTTIFLKGCPLHCFWCHNPESQSPTRELILRQDRCLACNACLDFCPVAGKVEDCRLCGRCQDLCPSGAREILGREFSVSEVMAQVEKDRLFYEESGGGVTFSGGEPLFQADFLLALLTECKESNLHRTIDTCGYSVYSTIMAVGLLTDLFLYDLKLMDSAAHKYYTGVPNEIILANLRRLAFDHPNVRVRTPIIPGITDSKKNLQAMAAFLQPLPISQIDILPYHNTGLAKYRLLGRDYPLDVTKPSQAQMENVAEILSASGHQVIIGGVPNE